jgi:hypothetical protein
MGIYLFYESKKINKQKNQKLGTIKGELRLSS